MKFFIEIVDSSWFSKTEMKYIDNKNRCFIGTPFEYGNNELTVIEASSKPSEYGCYRIIKYIESKPINKKK